jgi:hypothetical protein
MLVDRKAEMQRLELAAIRVQNRWRIKRAGYSTMLLRAARADQAAQAEREYNAAVALQCRWRGMQGYEAAMMRREARYQVALELAAIRVQNAWRIHEAGYSTMLLRRAREEHLAAGAEAAELVAMEKAALLVQCAWRSRDSRMMMKMRRLYWEDKPTEWKWQRLTLGFHSYGEVSKQTHTNKAMSFFFDHNFIWKRMCKTAAVARVAACKAMEAVAAAHAKVAAVAAAFAQAMAHQLADYAIAVSFGWRRVLCEVELLKGWRGAYEVKQLQPLLALSGIHFQRGWLLLSALLLHEAVRIYRLQHIAKQQFRRSRTGQGKNIGMGGVGSGMLVGLAKDGGGLNEYLDALASSPEFIDNFDRTAFLRHVSSDSAPGAVKGDVFEGWGEDGEGETDGVPWVVWAMLGTIHMSLYDATKSSNWDVPSAGQRPAMVVQVREQVHLLVEGVSYKQQPVELEQDSDASGSDSDETGTAQPRERRKSMSEMIAYRRDSAVALELDQAAIDKAADAAHAAQEISHRAALAAASATGVADVAARSSTRMIMVANRSNINADSNNSNEDGEGAARADDRVNKHGREALLLRLAEKALTNARKALLRSTTEGSGLGSQSTTSPATGEASPPMKVLIPLLYDLAKAQRCLGGEHQDSGKAVPSAPSRLDGTLQQLLGAFVAASNGDGSGSSSSSSSTNVDSGWVRAIVGVANESFEESAKTVVGATGGGVSISSSAIALSLMRAEDDDFAFPGWREAAPHRNARRTAWGVNSGDARSDTLGTHRGPLDNMSKGESAGSQQWARVPEDWLPRSLMMAAGAKWQQGDYSGAGLDFERLLQLQQVREARAATNYKYRYVVSAEEKAAEQGEGYSFANKIAQKKKDEEMKEALAQGKDFGGNREAPEVAPHWWTVGLEGVATRIDAIVTGSGESMEIRRRMRAGDQHAEEEVMEQAKEEEKKHKHKQLVQLAQQMETIGGSHSAVAAALEEESDDDGDADDAEDEDDDDDDKTGLTLLPRSMPFPLRLAPPRVHHNLLAGINHDSPSAPCHCPMPPTRPCVMSTEAELEAVEDAEADAKAVAEAKAKREAEEEEGDKHGEDEKHEGDEEYSDGEYSDDDGVGAALARAAAAREESHARAKEMKKPLAQRKLEHHKAHELHEKARRATNQKACTIAAQAAAEAATMALTAAGLAKEAEKKETAESVEVEEVLLVQSLAYERLSKQKQLQSQPQLQQQHYWRARELQQQAYKRARAAGRVGSSWLWERPVPMAKQLWSLRDIEARLQRLRWQLQVHRVDGLAMKEADDIYCLVYWEEKLIGKTLRRKVVKDGKGGAKVSGGAGWAHEVFEIRLPIELGHHLHLGDDDDGSSSIGRLRVEVWDHDKVGLDDFMGEVRIESRALLEMPQDGAPHWFDLRRRRGGETGGMLGASKAKIRDALRGVGGSVGRLMLSHPSPSLPRATLKVLWARGLYSPTSYDKNDVYAVVKWNGKEVGRTPVIEDSNEPMWERMSEDEGTGNNDFSIIAPDVSALVAGSHAAGEACELCVQLWDWDIGMDDFLGEVVLRGDELLQLRAPPASAKEAGKKATESTAVVASDSLPPLSPLAAISPMERSNLELPLRPRADESELTKQKYVNVGAGGKGRARLGASRLRMRKLMLRVHSCTGLPKSDLLSRGNDVYVRLLWCGKIVGQTKVLKDTMTPEWAEDDASAVIALPWPWHSWSTQGWPKKAQSTGGAVGATPSGAANSNGTLVLQVYDEDMGSDDLLGELELTPEQLMQHFGTAYQYTEDDHGDHDEDEGVVPGEVDFELVPSLAQMAQEQQNGEKCQEQEGGSGGGAPAQEAEGSSSESSSSAAAAAAFGGLKSRPAPNPFAAAVAQLQPAAPPAPPGTDGADPSTDTVQAVDVDAEEASVDAGAATETTSADETAPLPSPSIPKAKPTIRLSVPTVPKLKLRIASASGLQATDLGDGNDVYAKVFWRGALIGKTETVTEERVAGGNGEAAAQWANAVFDIPLLGMEGLGLGAFAAAGGGTGHTEEAPLLRIEFWDDDYGRDDFLGELVLGGDDLHLDGGSNSFNFTHWRSNQRRRWGQRFRRQHRRAREVDCAHVAAVETGAASGGENVRAMEMASVGIGAGESLCHDEMTFDLQPRSAAGKSKRVVQKLGQARLAWIVVDENQPLARLLGSDIEEMEGAGEERKVQLEHHVKTAQRWNQLKKTTAVTGHLFGGLKRHQLEKVGEDGLHPMAARKGGVGVYVAQLKAARAALVAKQAAAFAREAHRTAATAGNAAPGILVAMAKAKEKAAAEVAMAKAFRNTKDNAKAQARESGSGSEGNESESESRRESESVSVSESRSESEYSRSESEYSRSESKSESEYSRSESRLSRSESEYSEIVVAVAAEADENEDTELSEMEQLAVDQLAMRLQKNEPMDQVPLRPNDIDAGGDSAVNGELSGIVSSGLDDPSAAEQANEVPVCSTKNKDTASVKAGGKRWHRVSVVAGTVGTVSTALKEELQVIRTEIELIDEAEAALHTAMEAQLEPTLDPALKMPLGPTSTAFKMLPPKVDVIPPQWETLQLRLHYVVGLLRQKKGKLSKKKKEKRASKNTSKAAKVSGVAEGAEAAEVRKESAKIDAKSDAKLEQDDDEDDDKSEHTRKVYCVVHWMGQKVHKTKASTSASVATHIGAHTTAVETAPQTNLDVKKKLYHGWGSGVGADGSGGELLPIELQLPADIDKAHLVVEVWDDVMGTDRFLGRLEMNGQQVLDLYFGRGGNGGGLNLDTTYSVVGSSEGLPLALPFEYELAKKTKVSGCMALSWEWEDPAAREAALRSTEIPSARVKAAKPAPKIMPESKPKPAHAKKSKNPFGSRAKNPLLAAVLSKEKDQEAKEKEQKAQASAKASAKAEAKAVAGDIAADVTNAALGNLTQIVGDKGAGIQPNISLTKWSAKSSSAHSEQGASPTDGAATSANETDVERSNPLLENTSVVAMSFNQRRLHVWQQQVELEVRRATWGRPLNEVAAAAAAESAATTSAEFARIEHDIALASSAKPPPMIESPPSSPSFRFSTATSSAPTSTKLLALPPSLSTTAISTEASVLTPISAAHKHTIVQELRELVEIGRDVAPLRTFKLQLCRAFGLPAVNRFDRRQADDGDIDAMVDGISPPPANPDGDGAGAGAGGDGDATGGAVAAAGGAAGGADDDDADTDVADASASGGGHYGQNPDCYCKVYWCGRLLRTTAVVEGSRAPDWEGSDPACNFHFEDYATSDEHHEYVELRWPLEVSKAELRVELWDKDLWSHDDMLGVVHLTSTELLQHLQLADAEAAAAIAEIEVKAAAAAVAADANGSTAPAANPPPVPKMGFFDVMNKEKWAAAQAKGARETAPGEEGGHAASAANKARQKRKKARQAKAKGKMANHQQHHKSTPDADGEQPETAGGGTEKKENEEKEDEEEEGGEKEDEEEEGGEEEEEEIEAEPSGNWQKMKATAAITGGAAIASKASLMSGGKDKASEAKMTAAAKLLQGRDPRGKHGDGLLGLRLAPARTMSRNIVLRLDGANSLPIINEVAYVAAVGMKDEEARIASLTGASPGAKTRALAAQKTANKKTMSKRLTMKKKAIKSSAHSSEEAMALAYPETFVKLFVGESLVGIANTSTHSNQPTWHGRHYFSNHELTSIRRGKHHFTYTHQQQMNSDINHLRLRLPVNYDDPASEMRGAPLKVRFEFWAKEKAAKKGGEEDLMLGECCLVGRDLLMVHGRAAGKSDYQLKPSKEDLVRMIEEADEIRQKEDLAKERAMTMKMQKSMGGMGAPPDTDPVMDAEPDVQDAEKQDDAVDEEDGDGDGAAASRRPSFSQKMIGTVVMGSSDASLTPIIGTEAEPAAETAIEPAAGAGTSPTKSPKSSKALRRMNSKSKKGKKVVVRRRINVSGSAKLTEVPMHTLDMQVMDARGLIQSDLVGKNDVYCVVWWRPGPSGPAPIPKYVDSDDEEEPEKEEVQEGRMEWVEIGRTRIVDESLYPVWHHPEERFSIPVGDLTERLFTEGQLRVEVWDYDEVGFDDLLGEVVLTGAELLARPGSIAPVPNMRVDLPLERGRKGWWQWLTNGSHPTSPKAPKSPKSPTKRIKSPNAAAVQVEGVQTRQTPQERAEEKKRIDMMREEEEKAEQEEQEVAKKLKEANEGALGTIYVHCPLTRKLKLTVHGATDLLKADRFGNNDVYATIHVLGKEVGRSSVQQGQSPSWGKGETFRVLLSEHSLREAVAAADPAVARRQSMAQLMDTEQIIDEEELEEAAKKLETGEGGSGGMGFRLSFVEVVRQPMVQVRLWDHDMGGAFDKDDFLGCVEVPLDMLLPADQISWATSTGNSQVDDNTITTFDLDELPKAGQAAVLKKKKGKKTDAAYLKKKQKKKQAKTTVQGTINLSWAWVQSDPFAPEKATEASSTTPSAQELMDVEEEDRRVCFQVARANNLKSADGDGSSLSALADAYCVVYWNDRKVCTTAVVQDSSEPRWSHEVFEVLLPPLMTMQRTSSLRIEVWDEDKGLADADDFMAQVDLSGRDVLQLVEQRQRYAGANKVAAELGVEEEKELLLQPRPKRRGGEMQGVGNGRGTVGLRWQLRDPDEYTACAWRHAPQTWTQLGRKLATNGEYGVAVSCFKEARRLQPRATTHTWLESALALRALRRPVAAEKHLMKALAVNPQCWEAVAQLDAWRTLDGRLGGFEPGGATCMVAMVKPHALLEAEKPKELLEKEDAEAVREEELVAEGEMGLGGKELASAETRMVTLDARYGPNAAPDALERLPMRACMDRRWVPLRQMLTESMADEVKAVTTLQCLYRSHKAAQKSQAMWALLKGADLSSEVGRRANAKNIIAMAFRRWWDQQVTFWIGVNIIGQMDRRKISKPRRIAFAKQTDGMKDAKVSAEKDLLKFGQEREELQEVLQPKFIELKALQEEHGTVDRQKRKLEFNLAEGSEKRILMYVPHPFKVDQPGQDTDLDYEGEIKAMKEAGRDTSDWRPGYVASDTAWNLLSAELQRLTMVVDEKTPIVADLLARLKAIRTLHSEAENRVIQLIQREKRANKVRVSGEEAERNKYSTWPYDYDFDYQKLQLQLVPDDGARRASAALIGNRAVEGAHDHAHHHAHHHTHHHSRRASISMVTPEDLRKKLRVAYENTLEEDAAIRSERRAKLTAAKEAKEAKEALATARASRRREKKGKKAKKPKASPSPSPLTEGRSLGAFAQHDAAEDERFVEQLSGDQPGMATTNEELAEYLPSMIFLSEDARALLRRQYVAAKVAALTPRLVKQPQATVGALQQTVKLSVVIHPIETISGKGGSLSHAADGPKSDQDGEASEGTSEGTSEGMVARQTQHVDGRLRNLNRIYYKYSWARDGLPVLDRAPTQRLGRIALSEPSAHTVTIEKLSEAEEGVYGCTIWSPYGTIYSKVVPVMLARAVEINRQPESFFTLKLGDPLVMKVAATGTAPIQFKWLFGEDEDQLRFSPTHVGGCYNTYKVLAMDFGNEGVYACEISNAGGKVRSETVTVYLEGEEEDMFR